MTRGHAQTEREAFNAFCDGKEIEQRFREDTGQWTEWVTVTSPVFNSDYQHRIKPAPKLVPLGPEDVPPGSVVRGVGTNYWMAVVVVEPRFVTFSNTQQVDYDGLRQWEISRDGGKTWGRGEKEETK